MCRIWVRLRLQHELVVSWVSFRCLSLHPHTCLHLHYNPYFSNLQLDLLYLDIAVYLKMLAIPRCCLTQFWCTCYKDLCYFYLNLPNLTCLVRLCRVVRILTHSLIRYTTQQSLWSKEKHLQKKCMKALPSNESVRLIIEMRRKAQFESRVLRLDFRSCSCILGEFVIIVSPFK